VEKEVIVVLDDHYSFLMISLCTRILSYGSYAFFQVHKNLK